MSSEQKLNAITSILKDTSVSLNAKLAAVEALKTALVAEDAAVKADVFATDSFFNLPAIKNIKAIVNNDNLSVKDKCLAMKAKKDALTAVATALITLADILDDENAPTQLRLAAFPPELTTASEADILADVSYQTQHRLLTSIVFTSLIVILP